MQRRKFWRSSRRLMSIAVCLLGVAFAAHASEEPCESIDADLSAANPDELSTLLSEGQCLDKEQVTRIAQRLDVLIAQDLWPTSEPDDEPEDIARSRDHLREWVNLTLAREAFRTSDVTGARARVEALRLNAELDLAKHGPMFDAAEIEYNPVKRWDELLDILDRNTVPPMVERLEAPSDNWTRSMFGCGLAARGFYYQLTMMPTAADAWAAIGNEDTAVRALLAAQWVESMSHAVVPPRLHEFVERAYGAGHYEQEVERALAQIQIELRPGGRHASMPFFGVWVPLLVQRPDWEDEGNRVELLTDAVDIANYARSILLAKDDDES